MPALKNARYERFVQGLAKGLQQRVAYQKAGFHCKSDRVVDAAAPRLAARPEVRARLAELQERNARRNDVTVDSLTAELEAARVKAMKTGQIAAAVAAIMGKAKLHGFLTDRPRSTLRIGDRCVSQATTRNR
ncbi:terminase [Mesorhizobium sp.]|uniref:terminase n=1 Tax=Mesorhizobium sp. TaxID=1871066 RepID=UPI000FE56EFC|nr:terminase [Mesorhizobium sp.]RWP64127.1 MAG: terminase [Mesorhizobium sp.]